jgi:hypothetical protein
MDEDLKNPTSSHANEPPGAIVASHQKAVIRGLVSEALSENTDLNRLRELNKLIAQLLAAQQCDSGGGPARTPDTLFAMRRSLRQTVLDSYKDEYKEFSEVWKSVETKAQGTVTIAGIFIAAAFTFAKDLAATRLDWYGKLFLGAAIVLLIPSIVLSVLALRRRTIKSIPAGSQVEQWADDIQDASEEDLAELTQRFIDQHSLIWKETTESTKAAVAQKEGLLYAAQLLLLFAIGAATIVTLKLVDI